MERALLPANRERGGPDEERLWAAVVAAYLEERAARTGSRRTVETYGRIVRRFLRGVPDPASATPLDVHRFAYALTQNGCQPAPSTVLARLAAVSGLYEFAVRMRVVRENPAEAVRRPVVPLSSPRGLSRTEIARLLAVIPGTPVGLIDRALIVTALLTGLRRSELVGLRVTRPTGIDQPRYEVRTKGGTVRRRELPAPAWRAIAAAAEAGGSDARVDDGRAFALSDSTFYTHLRRYSHAAGLGDISCHALRHSAARLRRETGASIEEVSALLGHRSIATTATYLRRLEDEEDRGWEAVARGLGFDEERGAPAPPARCTAGSQLRPRPAQEAGESGWWTAALSLGEERSQVRHIPHQILPPPGGQPGDGPGHGPPVPVRIVRDDSAVTGWCPHCGGPLELSTVGARWHVRHPADVADRLLPQLGLLEHEELHALLLDVKCGVIAQHRLYVGNISTVLVRVGELFSEAVRRNAGGVLLVHNHPSGDATPSPDDLHLTAQAIAAGRLLDVPLLDHIVIAGSTYISLRERGVAFDSPGDQERLRRSVTSEDPASSRGASPFLDLGGVQ